MRSRNRKKAICIGAIFLCTATSGWTEDTVNLLDFMQNRGSAPELQELQERVAPDAPEWPIQTFLLGEIYRLEGDLPRAEEAYRALINWSLSDPYHDDSGGSGLSAMAVWRLLQRDPQEIARDRDSARRLLESVDALLKKKLIRRYLSIPSLGVRLTLARFKEDILRKAILVAFEVGDEDLAIEFFLDSIPARTTANLNRIENQLFSRAVEQKKTTQSKMALQLGIQLMKMGHHYDATGPLEFATYFGESSPIRIEAGYYLSRLRRMEGWSRAEIIELLDSVVEEIESSVDDTVDVDIAQNVMFARAIRHNREGSGRNPTLALRDFERIVKQYPDGHRVDDALYQIARFYEREGNFEEAVNTYERLRKFEDKNGGNDWINSSYFRPALMHYASGAPGGADRAIAILKRLIDEKGKSGELYLHSLFWLGRIYEERGDIERANSYFNKVINAQTNGANYYRIRAQMHINAGKMASGLIFPDEATLAVLRMSYQQSVDALNAARIEPATSVYLRRVQWAIHNDVYRKALEGGVWRLLRKGATLTQRDNPFFLDGTGTLASVAIQLALLHDALFAGGVSDRVATASQFSEAGDWTSALSILARDAGTRSEAAWMSAAFPPAFAQEIVKSGRKHRVSPEILYAIMQRESLFSPMAVSGIGALGLFQFMPTTFERLDKKWDLLDGVGGSTIEGYLAHPELSIELGARWFKLLVDENKGNELLAMMEHNAGKTAMRKWATNWESIDRFGDVEYMIETIRFGQTKVFLRQVVTSMAIAKAAGFLEDER